jgi:hypothetical protein
MRAINPGREAIDEWIAFLEKAHDRMPKNADIPKSINILKKVLDSQNISETE